MTDLLDSLSPSTTGVAVPPFLERRLESKLTRAIYGSFRYSLEAAGFLLFDDGGYCQR